jgi:carbonic anhydrase
VSSVFKNLKYDFPAGIAVFFVSIPLCLGIAHASGVPLLSGLISGIIGGLIVGSLSKSPLSVSGPAAGLATIAVSSIQELGSYEAFLLAVSFAGVFQLILGFLRAGIISKYIPHCVINGMLAAIGLLLIFKQIPHLVGYDIEVMGVEDNTLTTIFHSFSHINFGISIIGLLSLSILFLWAKYAPAKLKILPGSVIVVLFSTLSAYLYNHWGFNSFTTDHFVDIPIINSLSSFSENIRMPDWAMINNSKIYLVALTLALVASLETLLSIEAVDKIDPLKRHTSSSKELLAQGIGNIVSGCTGGLPITSVIVRSSVNVSAGGRTKTATILHGFLILLGLIFFAGFLNYIPLTGLAAVLIHTGYKLVSPTTFLKEYKQGWDQFIPGIITVISILFSDLLIGVAIGLTVSAFFVVAKSYASSSFVVEDHGHKKIMILGESIHFLHKYKIVRFLNNFPSESTLEIDASKTVFIDHDIEDAINDFKEIAKEKNITVIYGGLLNKMQNRRKIMKDNQSAYEKLIQNNKDWVSEKLKLHPEYFEAFSKEQTPEYLFIGCSDSRVPAEDITKCNLGEMFVHRNVANLVVSTDVNIMSVLQYAVEVLNVKHIILCGHYDCGGVKAAMTNKNFGLINQWLLKIKDIYRLHQTELESITDEDKRYRRLVELNATEQAYNILKIPFVQKHRSLYGIPEIHAWAYDLHTGLINDLHLDGSIISKADSIYFQY